ncbi:MAG TPA: alpha-1,4-glucan--maltose-1-phosphate maltosyltransferase [Acidimicrobiales bacterium]|nr:alpha-1,4-glucan--maltose-1-phosphate maltosyltransferase [Acidimicrobiales bacterium]
MAIEDVQPVVDCGRFAAKATLGDSLRITATVFCDGHDEVAAAVRTHVAGQEQWLETPMQPVGQGLDRFAADVCFGSLGRHEFTVLGWLDRYSSWVRGALRKREAGTLRAVDLAVGATLVRDAAARATSARDAGRLKEFADHVEHGDDGQLDDNELLELVHRWSDREPAATLACPVPVDVARPRARCGAWYELFPRSWSRDPNRHGTLADCRAALPYVSGMGFDVLYLPPIHPIGTSSRRGRNNSAVPAPDDVGSPWAIGDHTGGHTAIHPQLGTIADFRRLVRDARAAGLEIALDLAYQCSPDHPWVAEHPEWFRHLPDGTIQPAENPPKRYDDVYPLDFETEDWESLWQALAEVPRFWIQQGVRIFRVDNPHTKPFAFWEWLIASIRAEHPDVIFLAEAFTRPSVMYRLGKLGFDQSYTYFAWRQSSSELREYLSELTGTDVAHFFRPNAWPNTPDILTEQLQWGGRPAFISRLVLAATLFANYGIYGPAFELQEHVARDGAEEYVDNEKYELRHWDVADERSLRALITLVNRARHDHAALQTNDTLHFHRTDNPALLCYSKAAPAGERGDAILAVVNTDPHHRQSGFVDLDLERVGIGAEDPYLVHDLLGGGRFRWRGPRNYVELDPQILPAHLFVIRHRARTERDFDYF